MEDTLGWTPLHVAVEKGDVVFARKIAPKYANARDRFDRTPLSIAASKGSLELIELLIQAGANVNDGFPLHSACTRGHVDAVQYLIKNGADVNLEKDENYPIMLAAAKGNFEITKILLESGTNMHVLNNSKNQSALHMACKSGNKALISYLIDAGCDIEARNIDDNTPLTMSFDNPDLVKLLLEKGASVNQSFEDGDTCLHIIESYHSFESISDLIKHGACMNSRNNLKETPMFRATLCSNVDQAKFLLQHNADPNLADFAGWTVLHLAVLMGDLHYVEELLKQNANVNAATAQNIVPLHCAANEGHVEIVKILLEYGSLMNVPIVNLAPARNLLWFADYVNPTEFVVEDATPLQLAVSHEHYDVCRLLDSRSAVLKDQGLANLQHWPCNGVLSSVRQNNIKKVTQLSQNDDDLRITDLMGWTLLHHAVWKGFNEMASVLIRKGLSVNSSDRYERTPLAIAAARSDLTMVKLLLDSGAEVNSGSALGYAAEAHSIDCMLELIRHNCRMDVKIKNEEDNSCLIEAASNNDVEVFKVFLENKAAPDELDAYGETALLNVWVQDNVECVRTLIKYGADVNAVRRFNKETPLMVAVGSELDVIRLLIQNGANIDARMEAGFTALNRAASMHEEDAALELIKAGCSINLCNNDGLTPLFWAAGSSTKVLRALLKCNADVNITSSDGWSPLHEAAASGKVKCIKRLLTHGAKVNYASAENILPIYMASVFGHVGVVEELIQNNSQIDSVILDIDVIIPKVTIIFNSVFRDSSIFRRYSNRIVAGNTPLIGAASNGYLNVVKMLHSHGASLEAVNCKGNTALHEAASNNYPDVVRFLVDLKVNLNVKNISQKTPLDLAKEKSNNEIISILKSGCRENDD